MILILTPITCNLIPIGGKKMDLTAIKKYPSQISTAFKRFPVACAFAFFTFFIIIFLCEIHPSFLEDAVKSLIWLSIYPVAAMLIATATTLFQESRKSTSYAPQIITSSTWLVVSATLVAKITRRFSPFGRKIFCCS